MSTEELLEKLKINVTVLRQDDPELLMIVQILEKIIKNEKN
jgi:hypothetical protein